jgi:hypothetical protein
MSEVRVRRSRFLVAYWENDRQQLYNYATQRAHAGGPLACAVLDAAPQWTSRDAVRRALPQWDGEVVDGAVHDLAAHGMLDTSDRPPLPVERALRRWAGWNPEAGYFHRATQYQPTPADAANAKTPSATRSGILVARGYPPMVKGYPDRACIDLPTDFASASVAELLNARRTWRAFGERGPTVHEISTLLGLTFGVQCWADMGRDRWVALKTSPSGGARHSLEAYLLAFRVDGLDAGTYHYSPDRHALTPLDGPTPPSLLPAFIPDQPWFHDAPASSRIAR